MNQSSGEQLYGHIHFGRTRATRMTEAKKEVHRHLPGKYHSEPNVAAILLGRVDLRVDRQQFRNNMKIQKSLCAVSRVSLSCIGTGRRRGRPSQEPEAKPPFIYAFPANRR